MLKRQDKHLLLVEAAILLHQSEEDLLAIEILKKAICEKADYTPAYILLGTSYQEVEEFQLAEEVFRKALEIDADDAEALKGMGLFLVSQERYPEAVPYLQKQLMKNPSDKTTIDGLIDAYDQLPEREKDIEIVLQTSWEKSKDIDLGIRYGRYLLEKGDPIAAREIFTEVLKQSKTAQILYDVAISYLLSDENNYAIQYLREAVTIDPHFYPAWHRLSQCYLISGDYDKALEAAEGAIAINPNFYLNWEVKSRVYTRMKAYEQAFEASQKGIDLIFQKKDGNDVQKSRLAMLFLHRFEILIELNRIDDAMNELSFARAEAPTNLRLYLISIEILAERGKLDLALEILDSIEDPQVKDDLVPTRYKVLHQLGQPEKAWNMVYPYLEVNTEKRAQRLGGVGVELYMKGFREPALSIYRQLVNFRPEEARYFTNMGYMLIGEGKYEDAKHILANALKLDPDGLFGQISLCNLAYLYNLNSEYEESVKAADIILNSKYAKEDAILRVSFWVNGRMHPDPQAFPGREMNLYIAARMCGSAAAMASNQMVKAESYLKGLKKDMVDQILVSMVSGCLELAKRNDSKAKKIWKKVLSTMEENQDTAAINEWLADLA